MIMDKTLNKTFMAVLCCFAVWGTENVFAQMMDIDETYDGFTNFLIKSAIEESQKHVYDYDGDGQINCLDYACCFKLTWDKMFDFNKHNCVLVRNLNGEFHHLFAIVYDGYGKPIEVETWAHNRAKYTMNVNWPDGKYNPKFNIYGETAKWLAKGSKEEFLRRTSN